MVFRIDLLYPCHARGEKQIRAIPLGPNEGTIVPDGRIEILIARGVCAGALEGLTNPSSSMDKGFVKPTLVGLIGFFVSQVPLPENSRNIAGLRQYLRKGYRAQSHPFALQDRVGNSILHRMTAGHGGERLGWVNRLG